MVMVCSNPERCSAHGLEQASSKAGVLGPARCAPSWTMSTDSSRQIIPGLKAVHLDLGGASDDITVPACSPLLITKHYWSHSCTNRKDHLGFSFSFQANSLYPAKIALHWIFK